jgi:hypothetical protein
VARSAAKLILRRTDIRKGGLDSNLSTFAGAKSVPFVSARWLLIGLFNPIHCDWKLREFTELRHLRLLITGSQVFGIPGLKLPV